MGSQREQWKKRYKRKSIVMVRRKEMPQRGIEKEGEVKEGE